MANKLTNMAREILEIESDLPYRLDYTKKEKPFIDDFDIITFEQLWPSTALGFGGIGGQAMTYANTYVFVPKYIEQQCFVYFGSRFAYAVPYSDIFMKDVKSGNMASVSGKGKYAINEVIQ